MTDEQLMVPRAYSPLTAKLIRLFRAFEVGQSMTYHELHAQTGHEVRSGYPGYSSLKTAQKVVLHDIPGIVIEVVRTQGVIRPAAEQHDGLNAKNQKGVRRKIRKARSISDLTVIADLNPDDQPMALARVCQNRLMDHMTSDKTRRRIGQLIHDSPGLPSAEDLLKKLPR